MGKYRQIERKNGSRWESAGGEVKLDKQKRPATRLSLLRPPKRIQSMDSEDDFFEASETEVTGSSSFGEKNSGEEQDLYNPPQMTTSEASISLGGLMDGSSASLSTHSTGKQGGIPDDSFTAPVDGDSGLPNILDKETSEYRWNTAIVDREISSPSQAKRKLSNDGQASTLTLPDDSSDDESVQNVSVDESKVAALLNAKLQRANSEIARIEEKIQSMHISPDTNRSLFIENELNEVVRDANENHLVLPFQKEKLSALLSAAMKVSYVKKYYDALEDKFVYLPSVAKTIVDFSLILETEKDSVIPPVYRVALRRSAASILKKNGIHYEYMERLASTIRPPRTRTKNKKPFRRGSTGTLIEKVRTKSHSRPENVSSNNNLESNGNVDGEIDHHATRARTKKAVPKRRGSTGALKGKTKSRSRSSKDEKQSHLTDTNHSTSSKSRKKIKRRGSTGALKEKVSSKTRSSRNIHDDNDESVELMDDVKSPKASKKVRCGSVSEKNKDIKVKAKVSKDEKKKEKKKTERKESKRDKTSSRKLKSKGNKKERKSKSSTVDSETSQKDLSVKRYELQKEETDGKEMVADKFWNSMPSLERDPEALKTASSMSLNSTSGGNSVAAKRHRQRAMEKQKEWESSIHSLLANEY